eukprot:scaffold5296_cov163-Amphora_coffeaeformis.AAC.22
MKRSLCSSAVDITLVGAAPSGQQNILLRVIQAFHPEIVTKSTVLDANELLTEFLTTKRAECETSNLPTNQEGDTAVTLAHNAVAVGAEFARMATVPDNGKMQKNIRMKLEAAATEFTSISSTTAGILSLSLVLASLSAKDGQQNGSNRAASSAIMSVVTKNKWNTLPESDAIAGAIVLALLKITIEGQHQQHDKGMLALDLHILVTLARSFGVHAHQNDELSNATGAVINHILSFNTKDDDNDDDDKSLNSDADDSVSRKASMMGVLALAAQLDPWTNLSPSQLIQEAVPWDLWHGAERVCESVIRWQKEQSPTPTTLATTREAVHAIIDLAMETKRYRHADTFATEFYNYGGDSRFLEARFYHACDTIAKVIQKKVFPVIEKQVERVDAAVATSGNKSHEDFSNEIRMFALRQLAENGQLEAGKRLHELWNISHEYDEKAIAAAIEARKAKYIQWEEVVPDCPAPELISTADQLLSSFVRLGFGETGLYGFDAEWSDDSSGGVALLQIATTKNVMLIDVPALSMSTEGTEALKKTVGKLFACPAATVAGFACRQDMARLRSSPCVSKEHWIGRSEGIVDVQTMAGKAVPTLRRTGLSRACEHFLGKPLDKSEQCSLWTARPLTKEQRVYAALDALVCAVLYERIVASPDRTDGKASHLIENEKKAN